MIRRPPSRRVDTRAIADLDPGVYVELRGVLRAVEPVRGPLSGEALVGYQVLCSVFQAEGAMPEYTERRDASRWSEAVLEDDHGAVPVVFEGSAVRLPVLKEDTLEAPEAIARLLERCAIVIDDPPEQLQVLERGVSDGARVRLTGQVGDAGTSDSAYRTSARPRKPIVGVRGAPIVVSPG